MTASGTLPVPETESSDSTTDVSTEIPLCPRLMLNLQHPYLVSINEEISFGTSTLIPLDSIVIALGHGVKTMSIGEKP